MAIFVDYLATTPDDSLLSKKFLVEIYRKLKKKASYDYLTAKGTDMDSRVEDLLINLKTVIKRVSGKMGSVHLTGKLTEKVNAVEKWYSIARNYVLDNKNCVCLITRT